MLKKEEPQQAGWEFVTIESLVPGDHLLRKIDRFIDFGFIHERVRHLYCADVIAHGAGQWLQTDCPANARVMA